MTHPNNMSVLFVDHIGTLGGGQLGLGRYLAIPSDLKRSLLLIEGGGLETIAAENEVPVRVLRRGRFRGLSGLAGLRRAMRIGKAQVVVANSPRAALLLSLTRQRGSRYLYYLREDVSRQRYSVLKRLLFVGVALRRFDGFLANSTWTASTLPPFLATKPTRVAYPVSGTAAIEPNRASTGEGPLRLVFLGRVVPWKGLHVLLDAVALASRSGEVRIDLTIAGGLGGPPRYEADIRRRIRELEGVVSYLGHVTDVASVLRSADVLVSCSTLPEPFGQNLVQGLRAGLAIVATNGGGPDEIFSHSGCGISIEADDAEVLAATLTELATRRDLLASMKAAAVVQAAQFADEDMAHMLDDAVKSIFDELD